MPFIAILEAFAIGVIPSLIFLIFFDLTSFWLFLGAFLLVFLLGFQQLTVASGFYGLAIFNSLLISLINLYMYKVVPNVDTDNLVHVLAFLNGGPAGIVVSMLLHFEVMPKLKVWFEERKK